MSTNPLRVLITGGLGFLGQAVAQRFREIDARVIGLGHGPRTHALAKGYHRWLQADICEGALTALNEPIDVVVNCAGRSSVARSLEHPLDDFRTTVLGTAELLEYLRRHNPEAILVQASSAAVYGAAPDRPLRVSDPPNPVSPYGFHKQMAETQLAGYATAYGQRSIAVRFFSIYGPGLHRQLLWDAANKLSTGLSTATFSGTGEETRDWIHVADAARLIVHVARHTETFTVINGGSGRRVTVREALSTLRDELGSRTEITFNGSVRPGDPRFYHADMTLATKLGWSPAVRLRDGFREYAQWFRMRQ